MAVTANRKEDKAAILVIKRPLRFMFQVTLAYRFKGLAHIGNNVVNVFDANRDTY